jgi:hypothetical protein
MVPPGTAAGTSLFDHQSDWRVASYSLGATQVQLATETTIVCDGLAVFITVSF